MNNDKKFTVLFSDLISKKQLKYVKVRQFGSLQSIFELDESSLFFLKINFQKNFQILEKHPIPTFFAAQK